MNTRSDIIAGLKSSLPVALSSAPFGILFGALAVKSGFTVFETVFMSASVFAGASQMVGLELFNANIAPWMIVFSIFAVNFRHVLYSATIGGLLWSWGAMRASLAFFFLVDPVFVETERKREASLPVSWYWYISMATSFYAFWVFSTWVGASFGNLIENPQALGLDFILPVYFLVMLMGFRKRKSFIPVVLASGAAALLAETYIGSPWHVSLGALAGVLVAMLMPVDGGAENPPLETGE